MEMPPSALRSRGIYMAHSPFAVITLSLTFICTIPRIDVLLSLLDDGVVMVQKRCGLKTTEDAQAEDSLCNATHSRHKPCNACVAYMFYRYGASLNYG